MSEISGGMEGDSEPLYPKGFYTYHIDAERAQERAERLLAGEEDPPVSGVESYLSHPSQNETPRDTQ